MSVGVESDFSKALRKVIKETKPKRIIETGTYLGKGTTTVIASAIRDFNIDLVKFYSIEVNPHYYRHAYVHLRDLGFLGIVSLINGLSIHRYQLPNRDKIKREFLDKEWPKEVYIDHSKDIRVEKYFEETQFDLVQDGMLITCLEGMGNSPDLVLLDSGGHVGEAEFDSLIPVLEKDCIIALDDVYHVKHYNNLQKIQKDPRFKVLHLSREKFGFCIAKFSPEIL
jgi:predicted O-methyltransferase YrrM